MAFIKNTVQKRPGFDPLMLFQVVLALGLLVMALPAFGVSLALLPGSFVRNEIKDGKIPQTPASVDVLYRSRLRVQPFNASNLLLDDLAFSATEKARQVGEKTEAGQAFLRDAVAWQVRALRASPADSFGWSRLLYLMLQLQGRNAPQAPLALSFEIETSPYEPQLMVRRLASVLFLYNRLDAERKDDLPRLMRAAWKLYPFAVEDLAEEMKVESQLLTALRADPETEALLRKKNGN